MATHTNTQTEEKVSEARERAQRTVEESSQKLGRQTQEAFDQFREHDNLMRGNVAFWEKLPAHYYFWGAAGSVVLSLLLMLSGKQRAAIFVGLWPTTIINAALMAKQLKPSREV